MIRIPSQSDLTSDPMESDSDWIFTSDY